MNEKGREPPITPVMRNDQPAAIWHKCEPLADVPGGWALLGMAGSHQVMRREFMPEAGEGSEAVNTRAHEAGWEWAVANGGEPRPDPAAPSPLDDWVQRTIETMNRINADPHLHYELSRRGF